MTVMANENTPFAEWLDAVFAEYNNSEAREKVMICWALWRARDELIWNQKGGEVTEVITSGISVLNNWISAQDKTFDRSMGFMSQ